MAQEHFQTPPDHQKDHTNPNMTPKSFQKYFPSTVSISAKDAYAYLKEAMISVLDDLQQEAALKEPAAVGDASATHSATSCESDLTPTHIHTKVE